MPMIRHQAISQNTHLYLLASFLKHFFKSRLVFGRLEDRSTSNRAVEDVVNIAAAGCAMSTWHSAILTHRPSQGDKMRPGPVSCRVYTNNILLDSIQFGNPTVQTSEILRIIQPPGQVFPRGQWYHNGVRMITRPIWPIGVAGGDATD